MYIPNSSQTLNHNVFGRFSRVKKLLIELGLTGAYDTCWGNGYFSKGACDSLYVAPSQHWT